MTERQMLNLLIEVADTWYHKTGDKWYLQLGIDIARKMGRKKP